ncbi:MAG: preprotein translocase subunit SecG [Dysgonomonas sp.]|jgi:preprotein translocase subunit SecG|uniref:preprotein translocase subunit SecG n=1 Tax=unclassified Dysgonomonas TaxID=2630389 RepID=UPI0025C2D3CE|nr:MULTISPECIES: preprotein translocase subunit SecG [unclassified Dysgonomonas]MDR2003729.1 preprotein translocase subunit SecG [Prevotella sp.]HMM01531.1 preprotein translocase subunit SecG [Dysgonomonas sp.]
MITLITVLIVIAAIALVLIVLVQNSKGGGLSSGFSSSNAIMGVRKTTDFLEKATWGLAGFIMVMSIVCVMIRPKATTTLQPEVGAPAPVNTGAPDMSTTLPAIPSNSAPAPATEQPATPPAE